MPELALKYKAMLIFKQKYILKRFITFEMANSYCFNNGRNRSFKDFLQNIFIIFPTVANLIKRSMIANYDARVVMTEEFV